jgi:protease PrsW
LTAFLAISITSFLWLLIIRERDSIEPESFRNLIKAVVLGGVLSMILLTIIYIPFYMVLPRSFFDIDAVKLNSPWHAKLIFGLYIGIVEETAKAFAALIFTFRLKSFDEPVDGMIYGMAVGLGFAAIENFEYVSRYSLAVLINRSAFSVPLHIALGGVWGYGLALARFKYHNSSRLMVIIPFILAAAVIHGMYDFFCFMKVARVSSGMMIIFITYATFFWSFFKTRKLVAVSPFLVEGECPKCRTVNDGSDMKCRKCGSELPDRCEFYDGDGK